VTDADKRLASVDEVLASSQVIQPDGNVKRLEDSFLCVYGQKSSHLKSVMNCTALLDRVHRVYNFAGNPMMAKVADGTMSGVFELLGQSPHDVVPGVFIAQCAGATLLGLDGQPIDLAESLCRPAAKDRKLKYILCCTAELANDLREALS
jgi:fructose-1,6-bisphosphatase/inositol monophosphatase family enzyme